jgi:Icc-related predicted phosphoesterase
MKILSVSDIHGNPAWLEWILERAALVDLLLLPGDLVNGFDEDQDGQLLLIEDFLGRLEAMSKQTLWCGGNHDIQVVDALQRKFKDSAFIHGNGSRLELSGITFRSIGYTQPLPGVEDQATDIWIYHEPPEGSPVSRSSQNGPCFGCDKLFARATQGTLPLPTLVISGHAHRPQAWHWTSPRGTLFLNSGQPRLGAPVPAHLHFDIKGRQGVVIQIPTNESITLKL